MPFRLLHRTKPNELLALFPNNKDSPSQLMALSTRLRDATDSPHRPRLSQVFLSGSTLFSGLFSVQGDAWNLSQGIEVKGHLEVSEALSAPVLATRRCGVGSARGWAHSWGGGCAGVPLFWGRCGESVLDWKLRSIEYFFGGVEMKQGF